MSVSELLIKCDRVTTLLGTHCYCQCKLSLCPELKLLLLSRCLCLSEPVCVTEASSEGGEQCFQTEGGSAAAAGEFY